MEIDKWIRAARAHKGWTQQQLADVVGRSKANVGHWETGKHFPGMEQLAVISSATGYPLPKIGAPTVDAPNVVPGPEIKGKGRYPLISWVQAGEWTEISDNFQPGDADEWPITHHNLGDTGFVLKVHGNSMTAPPGSRFSFPDGMLLYVNAEKDATPGQFVIVRREREKEATFKKLSMVDGELFLEAINPEWPRRYIKLEDDDVFCGVVIDASFGNLP